MTQGKKGLLRIITLKISLFQTAVNVQILELECNYCRTQMLSREAQNKHNTE